MPKKLNIVAIIALCLGVFVFLHTLFYSDAWQRRARARDSLTELQAENDATHAQITRLRSQIDAMKNDVDVQARAVRQELGHVAADEIILEFKRP